MMKISFQIALLLVIATQMNCLTKDHCVKGTNYLRINGVYKCLFNTCASRSKCAGKGYDCDRSKKGSHFTWCTGKACTKDEDCGKGKCEKNKCSAYLSAKYEKKTLESEVSLDEQDDFVQHYDGYAVLVAFIGGLMAGFGAFYMIKKNDYAKINRYEIETTPISSQN